MKKVIKSREKGERGGNEKKTDKKDRQRKREVSESKAEKTNTTDMEPGEKNRIKYAKNRRKRL